MKRYLLLAAVFFMSAGGALADYVLIKINVNQLHQMQFYPPGLGSGPVGGALGGGAGIPGGGAGQGGGAGSTGGGPVFGPPPKLGGPGSGVLGGGGMPPPPPDPNNPNPMPGVMPEAPPPRFLSAFVEVKTKPLYVGGGPLGFIFNLDHKWVDHKGGDKNWLPVASPAYPMFDGLVEDLVPYAKEFDAKFNKEKKEKAKNVENFITLAHLALKRGRLADFQSAMDEAAKTNPKHSVVVSYQKVQKELVKKFEADDPQQESLLQELRSKNFKAHLSTQGHYCIYAQYDLTERHVETAIKRRLKLLEDTLEAFYYWFAIRVGEDGQAAQLQPGIPKHRLVGILANSGDDFRNIWWKEWGKPPILGDGFTPRRDNAIIMSARPRVMDPLFSEFDMILAAKITDASNRLQQGLKISMTREDLLSGKINRVPAVGGIGIYVAGAQTAQVLAKTLEDEAERATITNECVRQLLVASGMFPRHVQVPDWVMEGVAAFFETPVGALYPTIGAPSWSNLISFKHMCTKRPPATVLLNTVTDRYFKDARALSTDLRETPNDPELNHAAMQTWELARCSSWALVYYLSEAKMLDRLFRYGKELDSLPRDLDLDDAALQRAFARAFNMPDPSDPRRIEAPSLARRATSWFDLMSQKNLDLIVVQDYYLRERAKLDDEGNWAAAHMPAEIAGGKGSIPGGKPKGNPGGGPVLPPVKPQPPIPQPPDPPVPTAPGGQPGTNTWVGKYDGKGNNLSLILDFYPDGTGTVQDRDGAKKCKWSLNGGNCTFSFDSPRGNGIYFGVINGDIMSGNMTQGLTKMTWSVQLRRSVPLPGNPGGQPGTPNLPPTLPGANPPQPQPSPPVTPSKVPVPPSVPRPGSGFSAGRDVPLFALRLHQPNPVDRAAVRVEPNPLFPQRNRIA